MNYELKVTEINTKASKYLYQVIDEVGNVISERKSNKEYVACTPYGSTYFGRLDLIGKGNHGQAIKFHNEVLNWKRLPKDYASYNKPNEEKVLEDCKKEAKQTLELITSIAYKK
jgi:hypothetical protein